MAPAFTPHNGQGCPVPGHAIVQAQTVTGTLRPMRAVDLNWSEGGLRIVGYRVAT